MSTLCVQRNRAVKDMFLFNIQAFFFLVFIYIHSGLHLLNSLLHKLKVYWMFVVARDIVYFANVYFEHSELR